MRSNVEMRNHESSPRIAVRARCRPTAAVLSLLLALAAGCGDHGEAAPSGGAPQGAGPESWGGPVFVDRAEEAGIRFTMNFLATEQGINFKINLYDHGAGVAVGDADGDGDDDIYFSNQLGPNALLRNNGDGTFTDVTKESGPIGLADRICVCAAFNDIDNDGDQDLFVISTRGGNALFRNEGGGSFVDVTKEAGLTLVAHCQNATFFDSDGDRDLDLLVSNTARWTTETYQPLERYYTGVVTIQELIACPVEYDVFYRNNGDGTFVEATEAAGLRGKGWGGDTAVFDYDEDGDPDLFVANMFGESSLYRNDGKGVFEEVTGETLGKTPWGSVGAKAFDYDGDARLDLFVVDMHSDMWPPPMADLSNVDETRKYRGFFGPREEVLGFPTADEVAFLSRLDIDYTRVFHGNAMFRNLGGGRFEEVSDRAGVETFWPWSIASGDFDNDGFEDVYIASGMGFPWSFRRSRLLRNLGDGTFADGSSQAGVEPQRGGTVLPRRFGRYEVARSSRSAAVADFDGDGRLDIVVNNFNDRPFLYMNHSPPRGYIAFRLKGRSGNRDAVGAVVRIDAGGRRLVRLVQAAGGYLSQSSKTLHFGLGDAKRVDRCEILWPGGRVQVIDRPDANRLHVVEEPEQ